MVLYIDVYTTYTFVYTCICILHICFKTVSSIFMYLLHVFGMKMHILEYYTTEMVVKGVKFESVWAFLVKIFVFCSRFSLSSLNCLPRKLFL